MPWLLIEGFLVALILVVYITQIALPVVLARPLFPALRWRSINKTIAHIRENKELSNARKHVNEMADEPSEDGFV